METFSELLNLFVKRTGISDTELARAVGISRQTIFRWREGMTSRPSSREDVVAIANKLRLTPEEADSLLLSAGFRPEKPKADAKEAATPLSPGNIMPAAAIQPSVPDEGKTTAVTTRHSFFGRRLLLPLAAAAILVTVIAAANGFGWFRNNSGTAANQTSAIQTAGIKPAALGEVLILVAPVSNSAGGLTFARQLTDSLSREASANRLTNFRAEVLPDIISDTARAAAILNDKKAGIIIFGKEDNDSFLIGLTPSPVKTPLEVQMNKSDITNEQIRTLALITLGADSLNRGERERASFFLAEARAIIPGSGANYASLLKLLDVVTGQSVN